MYYDATFIIFAYHHVKLSDHLHLYISISKYHTNCIREVMEHGTVCVTGASGFLASWLIKRLLLSGYHVIGTVRDPGNEAKLAHLWNLQGAKERLSLVKAELTEEGSFDNAIMGCAGVFHMASPVLGQITNPREEIINPAVNGTLNVLRSCKKNPSLRRVVLTSSSSAVRVKDKVDPRIPLDESSWSSVELCEKLKKWYALSKTMAEKAAWEFCNENGITLVTVMPSFVVGPSLSPTLGSTASDILGLLQGETEKFYLYGRMGYVHIDDVALGHILVYEHENAEGRYVCNSVVLNNHELVSIISVRYPTLAIPKRFEQHDHSHYDFNSTKIKGLGLKFKSIEDIFDDCVTSLVAQGHLSIP
ncbi:putative NAD-dependent epimerase/dehydratase, tetraketide alpha-pyrone reductase 1 [Helianthus debilis subsp. tardiflorus]